MNNWLSGADPIPKLKLELIERLMQEESSAPVTQSAIIERAIAIPLSAEDYEAVKRAANGKDLDLYAHDVVMEMTKQILSGERTLPAYNKELEPFA